MTVPDVLQNARDLGGLPVAGGGRVRAATLYRSDGPMAGDAHPDLPAWPPRTVIDLRVDGERAPEHALAADGVVVHHRPLSASAGLRAIARDASQGLPVVYRHMLDEHAESFVEVISLIAAAEPPVLVHCAAGKDRTGLLVGLVLAAVGVPDEAIVGDYLLTDANMPGVLRRIGMTLADGVLDRTIASHPDVIRATPAAVEAFLDELRAQGGAAAWLAARGLEPATLAALRAMLVEAG